MASRGQTHQKRARELARRERRERKEAKKEARAAGEAPTAADVDKTPTQGDPDAEPGWIQ